MSIRILKKNLVNLCTVLPMLALFLFSTTNVEAVNTQNAPSFSGEELFLGIFFNEGKVAEMLPNNMLLELPGNKDEAHAQQEDLIFFINNSDEKFFSDFKKNMESGDHLLVEQEIMKASKLVMEFNEEKLIDNQTQFDAEKVAGPWFIVVRIHYVYDVLVFMREVHVTQSLQDQDHINENLYLAELVNSIVSKVGNMA